MKYGINIKHVLFLLAVFMVSTLVYFGLSNRPQSPLLAEKGVLDLTAWDFEKDGIVKLDGEWEFYWEQLLTAADFQGSQDNLNFGCYFPVPGTWNGYVINDRKLPGKGYATYRLSIKTNDTEALKGFKILTQSTAFNLMVDDETIATAGVTGKSRESAAPAYKTQAVSFSNNSKDFDVILQISNYTYARGGFWHSIYLGTDQQIRAMRENSARKEMFLFGVMSIMVVYYAATYWRLRRNLSLLYVALTLSVVAVRILFTGEYFIAHIFPTIPFSWIIFVEYMTAYWGLTLWILFLQALFPEDVSKRITRVSVYIASGFTLFTVIAPIHLYTRMILVAEIVIVCILLYTLYCMFLSVLRKREGAVLLFISMLLVLTTLVNDILYFWNILYSIPGGMIGIVTFIVIFIQAYILAARYAKAFNDTEKLSEKMTALNKLKDEFLANTSHELRTPVNSIIAITESVISGTEGEVTARQRRTLSLVTESGKRLSRLINDLLDYARIKNEELPLDKSHFRIELLVQKMITEFGFMSFTKNITIKSEIQRDVPGLYADKYRIIQVLYNLMDNAVKFTPANGTITVSVYTRPNSICISVRDTGDGIPEEHLKSIFKSFEQVSPSLTRKSGGMGLGLSISKRIVEAHRGDISVRSKLNEGAEFVFCLPLAAGSGETSIDQEQSGRNVQVNETTRVAAPDRLVIKGKTAETIVIIDDNFANLTGVAGILQTAGYSIKGFTNPEAGLREIFANKKVVLTVVDLMMPEMSGYEICERVRERYSLYELPVLILTARVRTDSVTESFRGGANDVIYKPFDVEELKARVNTLAKLKMTTEAAINNEIAMLQAQINPHFMFNTLNTLFACCHMDASKAAEGILNLSDYLRFSIDFEAITQDIPLSREMELVKAYLSIEKLRFAEKLNWEIDVADCVPISVPLFLVQPLVENAVRHGVTKKEKGGWINIKGYGDGGSYKIVVEDTGAGIREEDLARIISGETAPGRGIGLLNVRRRLKRLYGTDIEIESVFGSGTKVTITLSWEGTGYADGYVV